MSKNFASTLETSSISKQPRKVKRRPLACVRCQTKRIKCSKSLPCTSCIKKGIQDQCQPQNFILNTKVSKQTFKTNNEYKSEINQSLHETSQKLNTSSRNSDIYNPAIYTLFVRKMIDGTGLIGNMFHRDPLTVETNWVNLYDKIDGFINKLDFKSSRRICMFSCKFSSFIHQGVIPQLFIQDHDSFWENHVYKNSDVLFSYKRNSFLDSKARDFYYWLALYYINICTGAYFGHDVLVKLPGFVYSDQEMKEIPKLFFYMSLDCLFKAEYFKIPDIRSVQVYCCMSLCMHALGRLYLDDAILSIVIHNSKVLGLNKAKSENDNSEISFSKEIGRRLWQTLVIIEWMEHSDTPDRLNIKDSSAPMPKLITISQLLGNEQMSKEDIIESTKSIYEIEFDSEVISNATYTRFLYEAAKIKQSCYQKPDSFRHVNHHFREICKLRERCFEVYKDINFYNTEIDIDSSEFSKIDDFSASYAKFLLRSSLTDEAILIGNMLISLIGKEEWSKKYRNKCLKFCIDILQSFFLDVPQYYFIHWIIIQHLFIVSMYLLIDMLSFAYDECENDIRNPEYNVALKLKLIQDTFPVIGKLESSHFPAKVGLAVLRKLHTLVSTVKANTNSIDPDNGNQLEVMSLKNFLLDLKIKVPGKDLELPSLGCSQYLRSEQLGKNENLTEQYESPGTAFSGSLNFKGFINIDPSYDEILDGTGWIEFLEFFCGNQQNYFLD